MSTRANIIIRNDHNDLEKEIIYHHYDGYPDGVGRTLSKILASIPNQSHETMTKQELAKFICDKDPDFRIMTPCEAGDAEYGYEINMFKHRVDWEHLYTGQQEWLCDF